MPDIPWEELPFSDFRPEELAARRPLWETAARHILKLGLQEERICLVSETGSGKTIMAILVIAKTPGRVLFLAPKRFLTEQHHNVTKRITGGRIKSRIINGETPAREQIWDDPADDIVFATPEMTRNQLRYRANLIGNFSPGMIVCDEGHHTVGEYASVEIARLAKVYKIPALVLTASPGSTPEKIEEVIRHWGITRLSWVERPDSPDRFEDLILVEPDETLKTIDALFDLLIQLTCIELKETFLSLKYVVTVAAGRISAQELKNANAHLIQCRKDDDFYWKARDLLTKYRKLATAHERVMTESYETFAEFARRKIERAPGRPAAQIRRYPEFQKILALVENRPKEHPKVLKFIQLQQSAQKMQWPSLSFFYVKETVHVLRKKLSEACVSSEAVFGGHDRDVGRQMEVLRQLGTGEIHSLLSTDVLREGANVPELTAVIHYWIPHSPIAMIQGSGRTGRTNTGHVVFVALNHPLDKGRYYRVIQRTETMKRLVKGESAAPDTPPAKRRRRENAAQLPLGLVSNN